MRFPYDRNLTLRCLTAAPKNEAELTAPSGFSDRRVERLPAKSAAEHALLACLGHDLGMIWGFPKIRGTILGVPIRRTIIFWGLYWGTPILGNYHLARRLPLQDIRKAPRLSETPRRSCKIKHVSGGLQELGSTPNEHTKRHQISSSTTC